MVLLIVRAGALTWLIDRFAAAGRMAFSNYLGTSLVMTALFYGWGLGLAGRAFLPIVVGFGCNVPAVSATRILPNARHRVLTALLVPFTSCSARLTGREASG